MSEPIQDDGYGDRRAGGVYSADDKVGVEIIHAWGPPNPAVFDGPDDGFVRVIVINHGSGDDNLESIAIHLEAGDALVLAAHLQKAAGWVLDTCSESEPVSRVVNRLAAESGEEEE